MSCERKIVFLLGVARSGTKLLRDMLNNHTSISILQFESNFIPKLYMKFCDLDLSVPAHFHAFYSAYQNSLYVANLRYYGRQELTENEWYNSCSGYSYSEVIRKFYELSLLHHKPNIRVIGDKTPCYIQHVELLLKLFPDARFVHIVRDPRDRALSAHNVWGLSMKRSAETWVQGIESMHQALSGTTERLVEIRYEDLIVRPEEELDRILQFLRIPLQRGLSKLSTSSEVYGDARGSKKVLASNCNKFLGKIRPSTVKRLEEISLPLLKRYDYPVLLARRNRRLSLVECKILSLKDKYNLLRFHIREKGCLRGVRYFLKISK